MFVLEQVIFQVPPLYGAIEAIDLYWAGPVLPVFNKFVVFHFMSSYEFAFLQLQKNRVVEQL